MSPISFSFFANTLKIVSEIIRIKNGILLCACTLMTMSSVKLTGDNGSVLYIKQAFCCDLQTEINSADILTNKVQPLGDPHLLFKLNKKQTNRTNTITSPTMNTT